MKAQCIVALLWSVMILYPRVNAQPVQPAQPGALAQAAPAKQSLSSARTIEKSSSGPAAQSSPSSYSGQPHQTSPADGLASPPAVLWIYILDYENQRVAGASITYTIEGEIEQKVSANHEGAIEIRGRHTGQSVQVRLDDPRYECFDGLQEGELGGSPLAFQTFTRALGSATREQRIAYHQAKIRALIQMRERQRRLNAQPPGEDALSTPTLSADKKKKGGMEGDPGAPMQLGGKRKLMRPGASGAMSPVRPILSFIAGLRREDPQGMADRDTPATDSAILRVRILDERGRPVADVAVDLYVLAQPPSNLVSLADMERTDSSGHAFFRGLSPDLWYRAECSESQLGMGRSSIYQPRKGQTINLPPIALRPKEKQLCGFILHSQAPASQARVRAASQDGQFSLSTIADAQGYFIIAPAPEGPIFLEVTHLDRAGNRARAVLPADRETPEMLIPLDELRERSGEP